MKKRTIPALLLVVLVLAGCLRLPAEAVDGGYWKQSIRGKRLLILGDSYCAGYGLERREDSQGIAVRTGHMCAQPLVNRLGYDSVIRVSPAFYNTERECLELISALKRTISLLKGEWT